MYIYVYIYTWNPIMSLVFKVLGHKNEASPSKIDVGCLDLPSRSARWFFSRGDVGFLRWWYQNHWFIDVYFMENPKEKYGWWLGIPLMEPPPYLCARFFQDRSVLGSSSEWSDCISSWLQGIYPIAFGSYIEWLYHVIPITVIKKDCTLKPGSCLPRVLFRWDCRGLYYRNYCWLPSSKLT